MDEQYFILNDNMTFDLHCNECGADFEVDFDDALEGQCTECGGYDTEPVG